jgi:hypothetical protein
MRTPEKKEWRTKSCPYSMKTDIAGVLSVDPDHHYLMERRDRLSKLDHRTSQPQMEIVSNAERIIAITIDIH